MRERVRVGLVLMVLGTVVSVLLSGCGTGGDGTTAPATPSPTPTSASPSGTASSAVCAAADQLRASIDQLGQVGLSQGASGLGASLRTVLDDLDSLSNAAGDQFKPQIQALSASLDQLGRSLADLADQGGSTPAPQQVAADAQAVVEAGRNLLRSIDQSCP